MSSEEFSKLLEKKKGEKTRYGLTDYKETGLFDCTDEFDSWFCIQKYKKSSKPSLQVQTSLSNRQSAD